MKVVEVVIRLRPKGFAVRLLAFGEQLFYGGVRDIQTISSSRMDEERAARAFKK